jgi:mRNA interferase MazF
MSAPRRGEVWLVQLNPTRGHEQAGLRPALVLSVDTFNASAAELATILPITSKPRAVRTRVEVKPPEGGLSLASFVICEQVRTISTQRFVRSTGSVSGATIKAVEGIVRMLLGL